MSWVFFVLYSMFAEVFVVYVLQSEVDGSFYKGMTSDMDRRLKQHNSGKTKSTKSKMPWRVVYTEKYPGALEARKREKYFKSAAGRRFLKLKI